MNFFFELLELIKFLGDWFYLSSNNYKFYQT